MVGPARRLQQATSVKLATGLINMEAPFGIRRFCAWASPATSSQVIEVFVAKSTLLGATTLHDFPLGCLTGFVVLVFGLGQVHFGPRPSYHWKYGPKVLTLLSLGPYGHHTDYRLVPQLIGGKDRVITELEPTGRGFNKGGIQRSIHDLNLDKSNSELSLDLSLAHEIYHLVNVF